MTRPGAGLFLARPICLSMYRVLRMNQAQTGPRAQIQCYDRANRQGEFEFFNIVLMGRYTEASVKTMQQLTDAINRASRSSTIIGWALFAATAAAIAAIAVVLK
jgi:hypothetical protein